MKIAKEPPAEYHERLALACERGAAAYASQLSTEQDPATRERLGRKARQQREQAEFHRQMAEKLKDET